MANPLDNPSAITVDSNGNVYLAGRDSKNVFKITGVSPIACQDGLDNDGDGVSDFPDDPGCDDASDRSERSPTLLCDDGIDNDGDRRRDFDPVTFATPGTGHGDPGCRDALWVEDTQCQNGLDDDGDGLIDFDGGVSVNGKCEPLVLGGPDVCPPGVSDPNLDGIPDPDPQCVNQPWKLREKNQGCGIGFELVFLMLPLMWLHGRRTRSSPTMQKLAV